MWVGESSFWYRPTRVVPDQRPLNGRCCCCCWDYVKLRWLYDEGKSTLYAKIMYDPKLKAVWVSVRARYHVICQRCPKYLTAVVLSDVDLSYWTSKLSISSHLRPFSATLLLRMRRKGYLWTCSKISDAVISFPAPGFFTECVVSAIWRRFPSIFPFYMLNVHHISTSGLFDLLT